jgi:hypothetical protein
MSKPTAVKGEKKTIKIRQIRSGIGFDKTQKATLRALGLVKIGRVRDGREDFASGRHREGLRVGHEAEHTEAGRGIAEEPEARRPRSGIRQRQDRRAR